MARPHPGPEGAQGAPAPLPPTPADQIDRLERQLQALGAALSSRVAGAADKTLRHLELFDAAVQGLEASAQRAAEQRGELLLAAKRLATELRGLDLLAGHVKSVGELVEKLEVQAQAVIATAGQAAPSRQRSPQR